MRVREWYGWHFPELGRVIPDNILFAKIVKAMGMRTNALKMDFSELLSDEMAHDLKEAAQISMGTEVSEEDIDHVQDLCVQVISISEYREQLYDYLKNRMQAIAPNTTVMVGELVGARLIAHAGSLMNLAKYPASTIQILGAEKALFRSLKAKHNTPKYGLIYHASLVGQSGQKNKGKISRVLAAKTALSVRVDALSEVEGVSIGISARERVENRLRQLEGLPVVKAASSAKKGNIQHEKYDHTRAPSDPNLLRQPSAYNPSADFTAAPAKKQKKEKEEKKDKKKPEKEGKSKEKKPAKDSSSEEESSDSEKESSDSEKESSASEKESSESSSEEEKKSKNKKAKNGKKDNKKNGKKAKESSEEESSESSDSEKDTKKNGKKTKKVAESSEEDKKDKKDKKRVRDGGDDNKKKKKTKK